VKKKFFISSKDKKDWVAFTKEIGDIKSQDSDLISQSNDLKKVRKIDLHGLSLVDANKVVKKFIINSFNNNYKKLLIVTGKGLRSKSHENPYVSREMSVLKYSIPEYIKNDEDLNNKIINITQANKNDGGEGAIYIFLKKVKE